MEKSFQSYYLKGMKKTLVTLLWVCLFPSFLLANVTVTAQVDRNVVGVGQTFVYEITVSGSADVGNPAVSPPEGFQVVSQGFSQQISMGSGGTTVSKTYRLTVQVGAEGTYSWPPVKVTHQGQTYESQPVEIKVVPAAQAPPPPQQQQSAPDPFGQDPFEALMGGRRQPQQIHARYVAVPEKRSCYVNEEVRVTYKLYVTANVALGQLAPPTELAGFWAEEPSLLTKNRRFVPEGNQTLDGMTFQVIPIMKQSYFPLSSGQKKIGPASIQVGVDTFFGMGDARVLRSEPLVLDVKPLPDGRPAGFSGNTGRYSMSVSVDKRQLKQNEAFSVKVSISGVGNIKSIAEPRKPDLSSFKIYSSTSSVSLSPQDGKVAGKKVFEYVLLPLQSGKLRIAPFSYSFFDPVQKKYKKLSTAEVVLDVEAVSEKERTTIIYSSGTEVDAMASDIRFIRPHVVPRKVKLLHESHLFLAWLFLQVFFILFLLVWDAYKASSWGQVKHGKAGKAFEVMRKGFEKLSKQGETLKSEEVVFHSEKLLFDYLSSRLTIPRSELNMDNIMKLLQKARIGKDESESIADVIEEIHMYRYAPKSGKSESERVKKLADKVLQVASKVEDSLKVNA